jgi:HD superfamily phosphohydrolase
MVSPTPFEKQYPTLGALSSRLNQYFQKSYPEFFGPTASHPCLGIKPHKVIHDNLWGTNRFTWPELAIIDSPVMQRLRDIHQTGLAYQVYPSARHTRFEHCLGTTVVASRIFDALLDRFRGKIDDIVGAVKTDLGDEAISLSGLKQDLRLAALLHDTGHSLFSHASEHVFRDLEVVKTAGEELATFVGKKKGAGEVLSFCIARMPCIQELIQRNNTRLMREGMSPEYEYMPNLERVSLLIVGRSSHPFLQFMADIISSGFDADKLDYLLRDAVGAGLPLRYDLDRYLFSVCIKEDIIADDRDHLKTFYDAIGTTQLERVQVGAFPSFKTYRLRLPSEAMNTIEQIVISKMMLFTYIYHHAKCRAAEGMFMKMMGEMVATWRRAGEDDFRILERFFEMTDSDLRKESLFEGQEPWIPQYARRLLNRLLPREVYRISGAIATHAERTAVTEFFLRLQDPSKRQAVIDDMEVEIGKQLLENDRSLGGDPIGALRKTGVWFDVPTEPKFEDINELVSAKSGDDAGISLKRLFPIGEWTQAYAHYRYNVRIFAFSEYWEMAGVAARQAMPRILQINEESFYKRAKRSRS